MRAEAGKGGGKGLLRALRDNAVVIFLLLMVGAAAALIPGFPSRANLVNILMEFSVYGVVAAAMTFAIICGEFDLSAGSIFAFSSLLYISLVNSSGILVAVGATLLVGTGFGFLNGLLVSKGRIHAFVVTLGTMISVKGLALSFTGGKPVNTPNPLVYEIGNGELLGIPYLSLLFVAVLLVSGLVLKHTVFGRNLYATGGAYNVAGLSGINVDFQKMMIFVLLGFASALGGIMIASRMVAGNALYGSDLSLSVIAAVVIGGTSLSGGSGGMTRTFLGLCVVGVLFNILMLLGVQAYYQLLIKGVVLVVVVSLDAYFNKTGQSGRG